MAAREKACFDSLCAMKNIFMLALMPMGLMANGSAMADEAAWTRLAQPGAIVLFRHASAPGVGDPPGFKPFECATQRNLNDKGRAEARKLGEQFKARNIKVDAVWTSQWCRTRETAKLAFGDAVQDAPLFNSSFLASAEISETQTAQARAALAQWKGSGPLVVVTHQVNITALTGVYPASAQGVVVTVAGDGALKVVGTVSP